MTDVIITQNSQQVVLVTQESYNVIENLAVGPQGMNAYQVAVSNGFVGTVQDWLDSLVGPKGADAFTESSPIFTYVDGLVTRVDYSSGNYKTFTYSGGVLTQLDYIRTPDPTIRKVFTYNPNGSLASISESVL